MTTAAPRRLATSVRLVGLSAAAVVIVGTFGVVSSAAGSASGGGSFRGVPAELQDAGRRLGIPGSTLQRLEARWGIPAGLHPSRLGPIVGVYRHGHVYLGRTRNPVDELAYEYLHDVWAHLAPSQRSWVTGLLDEFDARYHGDLEPGFDSLIRSDMRNGVQPSAARLDELHSIACSRTHDEHLSSGLRGYCDFVLPGRSLTTKKY